mmetsp:Transcript_10063/g.40645  ORF Transcript_10063/g.40645 Transcript_10063/m.40645 type:complete len:230 (+) Transcript_10063:713-1402(+)
MRAPMNPSNPLRFFVLRVPFFLEPNYERNENWHETNRSRLERKWGGKEAFGAQKRRHRLKERGQEVGIEHFNLDRLASNTLASHRLVQWITKLYGCIASEAVYNVLNYKHFVEGKKLNDTSFLCETAAATAGANYEACSDFLATDSGITEIEQTQVILRNLGINSIPTFVIGGKYVVSGAVHSTELVRVFREIERTGHGAPGSSFADALQIPINLRGVTLPPPTGSLWI